MTDEECPVCDDYILPEDLIIELTSIRVGEEEHQEVITNHTTLHSSCFMDLINIDDIRGDTKQALSRTAIMEGRIRRIKEQDGDYYLKVIDNDN